MFPGCLVTTLKIDCSLKEMNVYTYWCLIHEMLRPKQLGRGKGSSWKWVVEECMASRRNAAPARTNTSAGAA